MTETRTHEPHRAFWLFSTLATQPYKYLARSVSARFPPNSPSHYDPDMGSPRLTGRAATPPHLPSPSEVGSSSPADKPVAKSPVPAASPPSSASAPPAPVGPPSGPQPHHTESRWDLEPGAATAVHPNAIAATLRHPTPSPSGHVRPASMPPSVRMSSHHVSPRRMSLSRLASPSPDDPIGNRGAGRPSDDTPARPCSSPVPVRYDDHNDQPDAPLQLQLGSDDNQENSSSFITLRGKPRAPSHGSASSRASTLDLPATKTQLEFPPGSPLSRPFSSHAERLSSVENISTWITHNADVRQDLIPYPDGQDLSHQSPGSTGSTSSLESLEALDREAQHVWRRLKESRHRKTIILGRLKRNREEAKTARTEADQVENQFFNGLRSAVLSQDLLVNKPIESTQKLFTKVQELRSKSRELEADHEELAEEFQSEAENLESLENRLYRLLGDEMNGDLPIPPLKPPPNSVESTPSPHDLKGIPADRPLEDIHPLFGDLGLAVATMGCEKEELEYFMRLKRDADQDIELKRRLNQKIPEDLEELVEELPSQTSEKAREISIAQRKMKHYRKLCEEKGVMPKHISAGMISVLDPNKSVQDIQLDNELFISEKRPTLKHQVFWGLLSQPDHLLEEPYPMTPRGALEKAMRMRDNTPEKEYKMNLALKEMAIDELMMDHGGDDGIAGFINRWMLFGLCTSRFNVIILCTIFSNYLRINNILHWEYDVLKYWGTDDTAERMEHNKLLDEKRESLSGIGTHSRTRATSDTIAPSTAFASDVALVRHKRTWSVRGTRL